MSLLFVYYTEKKAQRSEWVEFNSSPDTIQLSLQAEKHSA